MEREYPIAPCQHQDGQGRNRSCTYTVHARARGYLRPRTCYIVSDSLTIIKTLHSVRHNFKKSNNANGERRHGRRLAPGSHHGPADGTTAADDHHYRTSSTVSREVVKAVESRVAAESSFRRAFSRTSSSSAGLSPDWRSRPWASSTQRGAGEPQRYYLFCNFLQDLQSVLLLPFDVRSSAVLLLISTIQNSWKECIHR